jgi:Asp-tRNA(Asn)/Glu-tRNA(Gln) amidotransferase A subunit family amidase
MPARVPSPSELADVAARHGLRLTPADLESFQALVAGTLASYDVVESLEQRPAPPAAPREPAWPAPGENPLNAWYVRTSIKGAQDGLLAGKRVAVKDNVCVAGLPMMNGSRTLEGFVPDEDATIVTLLLDAGAEITGKAVCEDLCFSGGSHTSATGPVRNPWDPRRSAGGSSSGSAALVAVGEVDLAIGGDQGGSIRIPSAYSGTVGLKPTWGLVPYTGAFPIELTLDHLGPIGRTVTDVAAMLQAVADLEPWLRAGYDRALAEVDVLVMPTLPMKATVIPGPDASREEKVARALEMLPNTCPFDVTGHPALSVPAGLSQGLPVGMMVVGRHLDEGTVLRTGRAFERLVGGFPTPEAPRG